MKKSLEFVVCNYCGNKNYEIIFKSNPFNIVSCKKCKLTYLNPRPTAKKIEDIYQKDYFESGLNATGYSDYSIIEKDLDLEAEKRLEIIKKYVNGGKLIDIGCGYGHFLKVASGKGYKVMGFDISEHAIKMLKKKYKIPGKVGVVTKESLPKANFNIITSWDVVEHFPNPKDSFKALSGIQKKDGYFFFTTPSLDSIDAKLMGKYWYGFKRIPEHLYYFSKKHISMMLEQADYRVVQILPWGFYRNMGYFIDQTARYNKLFYSVIKKITNPFNIEHKSFFFPIIDMFVVAQKI